MSISKAGDRVTIFEDPITETRPDRTFGARPGHMMEGKSA